MLVEAQGNLRIAVLTWSPFINMKRYPASIPDCKLDWFTSDAGDVTYWTEWAPNTFIKIAVTVGGRWVAISYNADVLFSGAMGFLIANGTTVKDFNKALHFNSAVEAIHFAERFVRRMVLK